MSDEVKVGDGSGKKQPVVILVIGMAGSVRSSLHEHISIHVSISLPAAMYLADHIRKHYILP